MHKLTVTDIAACTLEAAVSSKKTRLSFREVDMLAKHLNEHSTIAISRRSARTLNSWASDILYRATGTRRPSALPNEPVCDDATLLWREICYVLRLSGDYIAVTFVEENIPLERSQRWPHVTRELRDFFLSGQPSG